MSLSEADVLKALNMDSKEFKSGTVALHINSASVTIDAINRGRASGEIVEEAKLRLAMYLSYLAYSDHPTNDLPVSFDEETGAMEPAQDAVDRDTASKLSALKTASDEATAAMIVSFTEGAEGFAPAFGAMRIL